MKHLTQIITFTLLFNATSCVQSTNTNIEATKKLLIEENHNTIDLPNSNSKLILKLGDEIVTQEESLPKGFIGMRHLTSSTYSIVTESGKSTIIAESSITKVNEDRLNIVLEAQYSTEGNILLIENTSDALSAVRYILLLKEQNNEYQVRYLYPGYSGTDTFSVPSEIHLLDNNKAEINNKIINVRSIPHSFTAFTLGG